MSRHEEILRILGRRETASAAELSRALGISTATLSRDLRQLQDEVCRLGRTRGARYARRGRIVGLPVEIPVYRVTEEGALETLGQLAPLASELNRYRGRRWRASSHRLSVREGSLSMLRL